MPQETRIHPIYGKLIMEFTGCTREQANKIEERMRDVYRTLDNIDRATFRREAKRAFNAICREERLAVLGREGRRGVSVDEQRGEALIGQHKENKS